MMEQILTTANWEEVLNFLPKFNYRILLPVSLGMACICHTGKINVA
jgi:hypothetical protein